MVELVNRRGAPMPDNGIDSSLYEEAEKLRTLSPAARRKVLAELATANNPQKRQRASILADLLGLLPGPFKGSEASAELRALGWNSEEPESNGKG
jgi:hypothetical protein